MEAVAAMVVCEQGEGGGRSAQAAAQELAEARLSHGGAIGRRQQIWQIRQRPWPSCWKHTQWPLLWQQQRRQS